jgi:hypothetical protein
MAPPCAEWHDVAPSASPKPDGSSSHSQGQSTCRRGTEARHAPVCGHQRVPRRTFARPNPTIATEEQGAVTKNNRQVSTCGHDGRLVPSRAANGTQPHWMTEQCRASSPCGGHDPRLLKTSIPRTGPDAIIRRLPLLQSPHRRLADPATGAAHA